MNIRSGNPKLRSRFRATSLLAFSLVGISVLSLTMVGYIMLRLVQNEIRREATTKNTMLASSIAHEIGMTFDLYSRALSVLGQSGFQSQAMVENVSRNFTAFEYIEISDRAGIVQFNSQPSGQSFFDISKRDYFLETLNASGGYRVSASFISERTYQPTAVLSVAWAGGIIAGHLNLKALNDYLTGIEKRDYEIAVIDRSGYYIANSASVAVYRRETVALENWYRQARGSQTGSRFDKQAGVNTFTCWTAVQNLDWLVIIRQADDSIFASSDQLKRTTIFTILLSVFLSGAIVMLVIRSFANDLAFLVSHSRHLVAGDYGNPVHYQGFADLAPLALNFDLMFEAVRQREESLRANERQISASLREKEVLLKEIHHRVKNNLQLVISLLSLKAGGDETLTEQFSDSIDRIRVMSMIHEMLYRSTNLADIDLAEYIKSITEKLLDNFFFTSRMPSLSIKLQPITVDIDTAIPCGLIINELLTNSLKYAFKQDGPNQPVLSISLSKLDQKRIQLVIADNGIGLPPGFSPSKCDSLGMQLVVSLTSQLGGSWELDGKAGTCWTIRLPVIRDGNTDSPPT
ncbi:MAG: hypothetical protein A2087_10350 [Spirochaetes bacterium GWD1_61_31]|nr:MAG: hypothetical protein A2Y37_12165 [Spirochaetes bacterium GWB1_60_80]OHD30129.1 MAG: hypothetical protein A2004_14025 [Spirochaetes bacterium GWC1_61_12]OHD34617.1 MAG: hypothetical protein A2087_10350 [Spirochaetes bacterium GWD1_61_31]OHD46433.1 MAG: hypothetical protein A2Y35_10255 [Spirochaetes bacterium GWE1_60_18]OHD59489.1 MAG: hypothetical protein A2Y32_10210 [Spirochaetes bacterium GWF1_60_12]